jgi:O-antigen ligase
VLSSLNLDNIYKKLLILLAFLLPLTVSGANTIIVLICFLWLLSGDYKSKFKQVTSSKIMLASIAFYLLHIIGMLWTEDIKWGLHMLHKMWYFLLFYPILFNIVKSENLKYCVSAFLLAISITEVFSYLIWFELITPFKNGSVKNPTPFMSHISYNPILAFAIYIVLNQIFFNKNLTNLRFSLYSFFAISMIINMFITGGRAGQVMFFAMLVILIFQFFDGKKIKSLLAIAFILPTVFFTSYQSSDLFKERVHMAISDIVYFSENQQTSVGQRITFTLNSWDVIKENPIIGAGTGDFPSEYKKINEINTPFLISTTNPHNMYILVLVQLGSIGLLSMLTIFYLQIKSSFYSSNKFIRDSGFTLPILFLVIMFSDSYLLGHYTTLLFVFFSAFFYKDSEYN